MLGHLASTCCDQSLYRCGRVPFSGTALERTVNGNPLAVQAADQNALLHAIARKFFGERVSWGSRYRCRPREGDRQALHASQLSPWRERLAMVCDFNRMIEAMEAGFVLIFSKSSLSRIITARELFRITSRA